MNNGVFFVILTILSHAQGARILGVYPMPTQSHYQLGHIIFKELARKGHDVTVLSPFKERDLPQNYKQVFLEGLEEKRNSMASALYDLINLNVFENIYRINKVGYTFAELTLSHPTTQKFLKEKHEFDLVIFHQFLSDAYNGFCYHFNASCVEMSTTPSPGSLNRHIGNPGPPSYVPVLYVNYPTEMNFPQRFYNTLVYILTEALYYFQHRPAQIKLLQRYFPNAPHLDKMIDNISLILVNSHLSISDVAPILPKLVEIGGAHVAEPRTLPSDLQNYLDNANEGVIFFSMGSNLKSKDISDSKRDAILKVFSKLKKKILWKWEDQILPNKPDNVKIGPWLPQRDILAHPNLVLFMTHGGVMSTIEAIYSGVPVLGIPVFSDQELNMIRAELSGYGKYVTYRDLTEESLYTALDEMLSNPKFKENAIRKSNIIKDRVVKPLDNAMYWIEYVLRHRGAPHLKSAATNLSWYQYHSLDVLGCALLIFIVIVFILKTTIKKFLEMLSATINKEKKQMKRKKN